MNSFPLDPLSNAISYLDAKSLAACESVCHHFLSLCSTSAANSVWKSLLHYDFDLLVIPTSSRTPPPPATTANGSHKQTYVNLYNDRTQYIAVSIKNTERLALLQAKTEEHFCLRSCLIPLTSTVATCAPLILLLIFTTMLASKLNNGALKEVPYFLLCIPIWMIIILYAVVFAITCFAARNVNRAADQSGWRDQWIYLRATIVGFIVDKLLQQNKRAYFHCAILSLFLVLIPIMLCVKLDFAPALPWTVTMIPIFLAMLWWTCAPAFHWVFQHHKSEFLVVNLFLWLPTLIVVALAAAKFDGVDIATHWLFMPYWLLDGLVLCVGTFLTCTGAAREHRHQQGSWLRNVGPFCATYCLGCCLLAPLVIFCALLSVREYNTLAPTTVLAPLTGWFVLTASVGCCFARGLSRSNGLQLRRDVEFTIQPRLVV